MHEGTTLLVTGFRRALNTHQGKKSSLIYCPRTPKKHLVKVLLHSVVSSYPFRTDLCSVPRPGRTVMTDCPCGPTLQTTGWRPRRRHSTSNKSRVIRRKTTLVTGLTRKCPWVPSLVQLAPPLISVTPDAYPCRLWLLSRCLDLLRPDLPSAPLRSPSGRLLPPHSYKYEFPLLRPLSILLLPPSLSTRSFLTFSYRESWRTHPFPTGSKDPKSSLPFFFPLSLHTHVLHILKLP